MLVFADLVAFALLMLLMMCVYLQWVRCPATSLLTQAVFLLEYTVKQGERGVRRGVCCPCDVWQLG